MTITLRAHQRAAVDEMADARRLYLNHDCGTGKTITILAHCAAVPMPTLVLAPKSVMRAAWGGDAQHFPQLRVNFAHGGKSAVASALSTPFDLVVTTFETFRLYAGLFDGKVRRLVVDEASKLKNHKAAVTRAVLPLAQKMERVYLLSGTPAPNGNDEWFAQAACIDPTIFGTNYWRFVSAYFVPKKRTLGNGRTIIERLDQTPEQRERFVARLAPIVRTVKKSECLDLPPVTDIIVNVELSPAERDAYARLEDELRITLADGSTDRIRTEAALTKLRQCVGGGYYHEGRPVEIGSAKLDAAMELLDEVGPNEPVVVWAEYRAEIDRLAHACGGVVLDGRTSGDAASIVARFQRGEIARLICHPQAAGHGITLTRACYAIYFGLSFSRELFEQSRARLDRSGQTRPVTNYILCAGGTIDRVLWKVLTRKGDVSRSTLDAIADSLKLA